MARQWCSACGAPINRLPDWMWAFDMATINCLIRAGFETLEQIEQASDDQLLALRNFGRKRLSMLHVDIANYRRGLDDELEEAYDYFLAERGV